MFVMSMTVRQHAGLTASPRVWHNVEWVADHATFSFIRSSRTIILHDHPLTSIAQRIAEQINARLPQVEAAITLLDGKATVPFIARYRKEATGGLDDTQLRTLEERLTYLRELEDRRAAILESIETQGKLTPALAAAIHAADTKARLEDLYLPYKPK